MLDRSVSGNRAMRVSGPWVGGVYPVPCFAFEPAPTARGEVAPFAAGNPRSSALPSRLRPALRRRLRTPPWLRASPVRWRTRLPPATPRFRTRGTPLPSRRRLGSRMVSLDALDERHRKVGVELRAATLHDLLDSPLSAQAFAVGAVGGHRAVCIRQCEQPC